LAGAGGTCNNRPVGRDVLHSVVLVEALKGFDLAEAESVHFYRNGIVLYLQRDSPDELLSTVEMACKLADRLDLKVPQSGIAPG
jgi:hypothetical protein